MRPIAAGLLATLALAGCGDDPEQRGSEVDPQAYAALSRQISATASGYGAAATAATDVSGCLSTHASYGAEVRPMVDRMRSMSVGMDREMEARGRAASADTSCGGDGMAAELARHGAAACASTAMSANHAEAARHAAAMTTWADHQGARAAEVAGMMGTGGGMMDPGSAPTAMACHRNGDGTFTLGP